MEISGALQNIKEAVDIHCAHFDENNEHIVMVIIVLLLLIQIIIAMFLIVWTVLSARSSLASFVFVTSFSFLHQFYLNKTKYFRLRLSNEVS